MESGHDPKVYAGGILKICRLYLQSPLACAAGVSGADLSKRMELIMTTPPTERLDIARKLVLTASAALVVATPLAVGLLGASPSIAGAQTETTPPSPEQIARLRAEQQAPRKVVPFDPRKFDAYVGYYRLGSGMIFTVTRDKDRFFIRLTGQDAAEIYPESQSKFFTTVVAAQFSFATDARGQATGLVLHQGGLELPAARIGESQAKTFAADLDRRIKTNTPSPGTQAALRDAITAMENGHPNYSKFTPRLATATREQWTDLQAKIKKWGPLQSVTLSKIGPQGYDVYVVRFQNAQVEARIAPLAPDGKISDMNMRPWP
ncbi:MAG: DUF3471 domain-containing protein [Caulobacteraceae bacterium]